MDVLGFSYLPPDIVLAIMLFAVMASTVMGWITAVLMGDMGLGVIGNTVVSFLGVILTLVLWNLLIGHVSAANPLTVIIAMVSMDIAMLMGIALLKRLS